MTGRLGGVVDYGSPHQKRAATHAYDRSGTAAFSWVSVGVRWPRYTASRWGSRRVGFLASHARQLCGVCAAYSGCERGRVLVSHGPWGSGRPQGAPQKKTTKCRPLRWGGGERTAPTQHAPKVFFEAVISPRFQTHLKVMMYPTWNHHKNTFLTPATAPKETPEENFEDTPPAATTAPLFVVGTRDQGLLLFTQRSKRKERRTITPTTLAVSTPPRRCARTRMSPRGKEDSSKRRNHLFTET